jgi:hypothetical protein
LVGTKLRRVVDGVICKSNSPTSLSASFIKTMGDRAMAACSTVMNITTRNTVNVPITKRRSIPRRFRNNVFARGPHVGRRLRDDAVRFLALASPPPRARIAE